MKINEQLSIKIAKSISEHTESGTLLPKTPKEIFNNGDFWFPKFDEKQNLIGFFEYRTHENTALAEMGSVLVLKPNEGIGKCLIQIFNTQKDIWGASGGFAVTKDLGTAYNFFEKLTEGDVVYNQKDFPEWFERISSDKYFIQWR